MEWGTLLSTLAGGGIATASASLLDHRRWKRESGDQHIQSRRTLYVTYLTALAAARNACRVAVRDSSVDLSQHRPVLWETLEVCTGLRYEVSISAPKFVVRPSDDSFELLRDICEVVTDGHGHSSDEYINARPRYDKAHQALRDAMRRDLGNDTH